MEKFSCKLAQQKNVWNTYNNMRVLLILVILVLIEANSSTEQLSHCTSSNEIEEQCGAYCYKIVRPLLQHAARVYSKEQQFVELQDKIHGLERTILSMTIQQAQHVMRNDLIATKNELINRLELNVREKEAQIMQLKTQNRDRVILRNLSSEQETLPTLVKSKVEIIESKEKQLKDQSSLIETLQKSNENLLEMLRAKNNTLDYEIKQKNDEIASLQSEVSKVSELEKQVSDLKSQLESEKPQATRPESKSLNDSLSDDSTQLCDAIYTAPGWIVVQRRLNGSVSFNRSWRDYSKGFGNAAGDFFIGLERLHIITKSQRYELYICTKDADGIVRYSRYNHFLIGCEAESYKLKLLGLHKGTMIDLMTPLLRSKFFTPDNDSPQSCATLSSSGWWFKKPCFVSNPNSPFGYFDDGNGNYVNYNLVLMMIKPTAFKI